MFSRPIVRSDWKPLAVATMPPTPLGGLSEVHASFNIVDISAWLAGIKVRSFFLVLFTPPIMTKKAAASVKSSKTSRSASSTKSNAPRARTAATAVQAAAVIPPPTNALPPESVDPEADGTLDGDDTASMQEICDSDDEEKALGMSPFLFLLTSLTRSTEAAKKTWRSPIYSFFKTDVTIDHIDGRLVHIFHCTAPHCKNPSGVR